MVTSSKLNQMQSVLGCTLESCGRIAPTSPKSLSSVLLANSFSMSSGLCTLVSSCLSVSSVLHSDEDSPLLPSSLLGSSPFFSVSVCEVVPSETFPSTAAASWDSLGSCSVPSFSGVTAAAAASVLSPSGIVSGAALVDAGTSPEDSSPAVSVVAVETSSSYQGRAKTDGCLQTI